MIDKLGFDDTQAIEHSMLTRAIENAQKKVEARNFDIRKHVLQYDDVMNKQREVIYAQRRTVLEGQDLKEQIMDMVEDVVDTMLDIYTTNSQYPEEWDLKGLREYGENIFIPRYSFKIEDAEKITREELKDMLMEIALREYDRKEQEFGSEQMRELERVILLKVVDMKWMEHIDNMDQLRQGIGLRAYGQEDPVRAYQVEGYDMFHQMINTIKEDTVKHLYHVQLKHMPQREKVAEPVETGNGKNDGKPVTRKKKVGRNDPCPCGSGKKYKKCCGR